MPVEFVLKVTTIIVLLSAIWPYLLAILLVCYVVGSLAHMKALKALGYDKPWMAWIPFANYYAYADSVTQGEESVTLFGYVTIPVMVYKLWWIASIVVLFIPVLSTVIKVIFLGNCYVKMYARLENTSEQNQLVVGYLSGFLVIIAVAKFLVGKYDTKIF